MAPDLMYCTKCGAAQDICEGCGKKFPKKKKSQRYCKKSCLMRKRREKEVNPDPENTSPLPDLLPD